MNDGKYKDGGMNGNTHVRVAKQITEFVKERTNVIALFVGQVTKSGEFAGKNMVKHMLDMHLHLYIDLDKRSETWGERIFTNRKNRFGCSGKTYVLGLEETGLFKKGQFV
jgi:predicted ATP-dependent serine protease